MEETTHGFCECGCGSRTNTDKRGGQQRFVRGHNRRGRGRGWVEGGYRYVRDVGRKVALHRLVVEQREGRRLRSSEIVHHVDHDPLNNASDNLVILSRAEHQRLHSKGIPKRRWTPEEKGRARELRAAGMTLQEIANALARPFSSTAWQLAKDGE